MDKLDKRQPDLWEAMIKAGLCATDKPSSARGMIDRWIRKGIFDYPRNDTDRKYSKQMIEDIIKAFSPNGKGKWSIKDYV